METQITLKGTPSEFDTLRDALKAHIDQLANQERDPNSLPSVRQQARTARSKAHTLLSNLSN